ncbi:MAG: hypothetical protein QXL94_01610 [Candidatus Parvarchaeum sp.]
MKKEKKTENALERREDETMMEALVRKYGEVLDIVVEKEGLGHVIFKRTVVIGGAFKEPLNKVQLAMTFMGMDMLAENTTLYEKDKLIDRYTVDAKVDGKSTWAAMSIYSLKKDYEKGGNISGKQ